MDLLGGIGGGGFKNRIPKWLLLSPLLPPGAVDHQAPLLDKSALQLPEGRSALEGHLQLSVTTPTHALALVDPNPAFSLPAGLTFVQTVYVDGPQLGVFCTESIPHGVRFGPFQGKVVNTSEIKTYDDNSLMWEVTPRVRGGGGGEKPPSPTRIQAGGD